MGVKRFTDEKIYKANNINTIDYINELNKKNKTFNHMIAYITQTGASAC